MLYLILYILIFASIFSFDSILNIFTDSVGLLAQRRKTVDWNYIPSIDYSQ